MTDQADAPKVPGIDEESQQTPQMGAGQLGPTSS